MGAKKYNFVSSVLMFAVRFYIVYVQGKHSCEESSKSPPIILYLNLLSSSFIDLWITTSLTPDSLWTVDTFPETNSNTHRTDSMVEWAFLDERRKCQWLISLLNLRRTTILVWHWNRQGHFQGMCIITNIILRWFLFSIIGDSYFHL